MYGNQGGFGPRRSFAPVKEGDELELEIEAVGEKGDGIAKKDGFVLFVPNTKQGDKVKVKVTRVLRRVGFAEVVGGASEGSSTETAPAGEAETSAEDFAQESTSEEDAPADAPAEDSEDFGEEDQ